MGRGVSAGGGQSSLGYLFGSGEAPKPVAINKAPAETQSSAPAPPPQTAAPKAVDSTKQVPAGLNSNSANNYMRADGQNTGNFITVYLFLSNNGVTDTVLLLHLIRSFGMVIK